MTIVAILAAALVATIVTAVVFSRKIASMKTAHQAEIRETFQRAHDVGFSKGHVGAATAELEFDIRPRI